MNAQTATFSVAPVKHSRFAVPGMRCAGCIGKLERGLPGQPGIVSARVNFTAKRVSVEHAESVPLPELKEAFARLGFEAQPLSEAPEQADTAESKGLLRAMAVAGFASMNVMLLSVAVWSGATGATRELFHWLSALIALPTIAYAGRPFFRSAWGALKAGGTNMDVPISIGVVLVGALSLFETIVGGEHAYFDGAVMLLFFLLCGRFLDSVMRDRARDAVTALMNQMPHGAMVLGKDGRSAWVDARDLEPGMVMQVAAGERLAADGVVESGTSALDLSLLTGESAPQPIATGSSVHAGTLNLDAPVTVRIDAIGEDRLVSDIARMMEEAGQGKSRYVRLADRAARLYAPAVHTLAMLSFVGWMMAGAGWHEALLIAVAVLIITCPCALGLAVPAAQIVTAGALMRRGVLIKDGAALERLSEADCARFDKTGTLTLGRPEPEGVEALDAEQRAIALALAQTSRHPLSRALAKRLGDEGVVPAELTEVHELAGFGVEGRWGMARVALRRPEVAAGAMLATQIDVEGRASVLIRFSDSIRPDAAGTLARLKALGIDSAILSGDRAEAVSPIGRVLGLTSATSLLPGDKLAIVRQLARAGRKVLMVGDGMNDGPALAAGHVSIAPSSASDVGQTAADVVFMGDSLAPVALAVRAGRRTMRVVRQNLALAIVYNAVAVPLAILGFVTPLVAAAAMSGSSILVVANALRLRSL